MATKNYQTQFPLVIHKRHFSKYQRCDCCKKDLFDSLFQTVFYVFVAILLNINFLSCNYLSDNFVEYLYFVVRCVGVSKVPPVL